MYENTADQVLVVLRRIIRAIDIHSRDLVRNYGLTGPQLILLKELTEFRKRTVGDLAKTVSLSNATVTDILDRLEKRGLIQRSRSDTDRRRVLVSITEEGEKLLQNVPSLLQERFIAQFEKLEIWEQTLILSSLQRIASMMEVKDLDASPVLISGPLDSSGEDLDDYGDNQEY